MLCEIHDPYARELLLKAGLNSAHRYVEFGCALGYVTRWAASQAAHATGIDLSDEHLSEARRLTQAAALPNVAFKTASIYEPGLPPESFDYSYSRWLLVHLQRPVDAMKSIYTALKPGGFMVCDELDLSQIYAEPPSEAYNQIRDVTLTAACKRGVDFTGGRKLHTWAKEAGFEIVHVGAFQPHFVSGPYKSFWTWTFLAGGPAMISEGALTEAQLEEFVRGMRAADEDPRVLVGQCRTHQLIARKPG